MQKLEGVGLGLRELHIADILQKKPAINWFECLLDNWLADGGFMRKALLAVAESYPLALHGVGLSIGSAEPIDLTYLDKVKLLLNDTAATIYSEHCSFSSTQQNLYPDLYPFPYTQETLDFVSSKVEQVQDYLERQLILENISSYIEPKASEMTEAEFLEQLCQKSGCGLLLDVNNIYVNAINAATCPQESLADYPLQYAKQIHVAGHQLQGDILVDTHSAEVSEEVLDLLLIAMQKLNSVPILLEWDNNLPEFDKLLTEYQKVQARALSARELAYAS